MTRLCPSAEVVLDHRASWPVRGCAAADTARAAAARANCRAGAAAPATPANPPRANVTPAATNDRPQVAAMPRSSFSRPAGWRGTCGRQWLVRLYERHKVWRWRQRRPVDVRWRQWPRDSGDSLGHGVPPAGEEARVCTGASDEAQRGRGQLRAARINSKIKRVACLDSCRSRLLQFVHHVLPLRDLTPPSRNE